MASSSLLRGVRELCLSTKVGGRKPVGMALWRFRSMVTLPRKALCLCQSLGSMPSNYGSGFRCYSAVAEANVGFPKPEEIQWQKDIANNVTLIGNISNTVDIKYLDSGKITASCNMSVKRPSTSQKKDESNFVIQFWDELAEIAAAHLKKDDRVYIVGSIWVETFVGNDNVQKTVCKVVARDLKFVGANNPSVQDSEGEQSDKILSPEEQWKDYFNNPRNYWDNRVGKKNPRAPDFKHKVSGAPLWIDSKSTPLWATQRLQKEQDLGTGSTQERSIANTENEKLWQAFFANPSDWWDNRISKKNPKGPDFKHKETGEALWIDSYSSPGWVKSQLQVLDEKAKSVKEQGGKVDWLSSSRDKKLKTSFEEEDLNFF